MTHFLKFVPFKIFKGPGECVPIGQRCSPFTSPYHACCDGICEVEPPACLKENPPCVFDLDLGGAGTCWKGNKEHLTLLYRFGWPNNCQGTT